MENSYDGAARSSPDAYRRRSPDTYSRRSRGGARTRSRSPPNIDRYQPDRPYRDEYRQRDEGVRRRSPPPVQAGIDRYVPGHDPPTPVLVNPLPNPMSLDYQVGFTWFAEWWRVEQAIKDEKERQKTGARRPPIKGDKEGREERANQREQIQVAYDEYKEKLQAQMARSFVQQHKGEEWFKERYEPDVRASFRSQLIEFRRAAYAKWEQDINAGLFDEFTLEGIYKSESNGAGGIIEKEEGEAVAANEVLGVGDLLPTKGGELRDPAAMQPTLLIKTIAPTVSREKMEAFCKEHLGEGDGGFRWLSLSDPNPLKKYHRIGWVMLKPSGEEPMQVDEQANGEDEAEEGEEGEEGEDAGVKTQGPTVTTSLANKSLELINGKTIHDEARGDFTCHVGIHEPPVAPRKKALWDLFSAPERIERDLDLAMRLVNRLDAELGASEQYDGVKRITDRVEILRGQGWLQPPISAPASSKTAKNEDDMDDEEEGALNEDEDSAEDDEVDDEELLVKKKQLDLLVEYLRRVYNFCLFCVFESDSVHELTRKCPGGHLRRPRASLTTAAKTAARASASNEPFPFKKQEPKDEEDPVLSPIQEKKQFKGSSKSQQQLQRAFNWVRTYEDKLLQILEPENVDLRKIGGKPADEALEDELNKYFKQEDESKFRCKVPDCTKLFKGHNFWRKHVEKRHDEFFNKLKKETELVNAYVLDPAHIAPSRSDANSNGHFPLKDHVPAGTPRGFNLANMQVPGLSTMFNNNNMPPNLTQIAAFMAQNGIPSNWATSVSNEEGSTGPMRRNRTQMNNRTTGPYDRQSKEQRNMRWNSSGRLSPPRGAGAISGGSGLPRGPPRFGEGGAMAMGPREAVQGRSLKSYEDLDAAGAGATGELDY